MLFKKKIIQNSALKGTLVICKNQYPPPTFTEQGDSGAALRDFDGRVFGIVSYGTACDKIVSELMERNLGPEVGSNGWKLPN